ncbi:ABC transporter substrate-binding protein [Oribacterium sp. WCC10]|uniref:ABC transporter substrate-binding protein n=1 Tax=Oribacterium sp. WCC10 TaxID=1855343 RepID=UPI0008E1B501|nr:ABC transporter substrate-binding protein [Oribacterium sp. WCC10]SFG07703.1 branched-chain amino acid transport system substrate-binding protein [Oribacterium sp. WCC10]
MKRLLSVVLTGAMAVSLAACGSSGSGSAASTTAAASGEKTETAAAAASSDATWKFGSQGPLTGGAAVYGTAVVNGTKVAVDEINAAGGINGYQIEFQSADDEHDQEKAINAYNSLKDWGMQVLIGPTTSAPTIAVGSEAVNDNLFMITPSGSAVDCTKPANAFRVCFSDPAQGAKSAQYIGEHKLATKVAILYDSSDVYSSGIYESFVAEAANQGIEVVDTEQFTADSKTDFSTQLQKMQASGAELAFLPFYYTEAALVLKQADSMGFKPVFFGVDGMDGILDLDNFDTSLAEGLMLLTPFSADADDDATKNFVAKYKEAYGSTPIQFAADAYDAVYIVKAAAEAANLTPDKSVDEIGTALEEQMKSLKYDGITGAEMTWDDNGDVDKEPKAVVIKDGAYVSAE